MKRILLATVAAVSLGLASAAHAQTTEPAPAPPVQAPAQAPDTNVGQLGSVAQAPPADAVTTEQAAENAEAMAASPASPADTATVTPALTNASAVCQPRVTSVHFGRSNALSQQNRNAIEYAVDAASVCSLEQVVIADSGQGSRRADAVRATLVRQGVPAERIRIDASAAPSDGAATGQLDVRMQFAGVANTDIAAATAAQAPLTPDATLTAPDQPQEEQSDEAEAAPVT